MWSGFPRTRGDRPFEVNDGNGGVLVPPAHARIAPRAPHLSAFHSGGVGRLLPNSRTLDTFLDQPPSVAGANTGDRQAGLTAAANDASSDRTRGPLVDASAPEAQLSGGYMPIPRLESAGIAETRPARCFRGGGSSGSVLPAPDGYMALLTLAPRQFAGLLNFMGRPDWATPEMFADPAAYGPALNRWLREWFAPGIRGNGCMLKGRRTASPLRPTARRPRFFRRAPQRERGFYAAVDHPAAGPLEYAGAPFRLDATPTTLPRRPAPARFERTAFVVGRTNYGRILLMTRPTADAESTLTISRTINAARERVFQAWTDPADLQHWWRAHPEWTTPIVSVDRRIGGRYRLGMQDPAEEHPYVVGGVYREISAPERLVVTWTWEKRPGDAPDWTPAETLLTLALHHQDGATALRLTQEQFPDRNMRDQHHDGWNGCLELLAQYLAGYI